MRALKDFLNTPTPQEDRLFEAALGAFIAILILVGIVFLNAASEARDKITQADYGDYVHAEGLSKYSEDRYILDDPLEMIDNSERPAERRFWRENGNVIASVFSFAMGLGFVGSLLRRENLYQEDKRKRFVDILPGRRKHVNAE